MLEFLNHEIQKTKDLYLTDYRRMVSYYNQEKATIKDYNGRQLLELIQNADDSGSSKVIIKIDSNKNILSISNLGEPFSKEGYQSLMIPNLSSKRKTSYIGNKGLGFRSIINWSNQIKIIDKDITVAFSKEIARTQFKKLFSANKRQLILNEFELDKHTVPLPFLAIPKISTTKKKVSLTTTIEIQYKEEFYEDIIEQVEELQPEILLFLNHISEVRLEGFDDLEGFKSDRKSIHKSSNGHIETITIDDETWRIFEKKGLLDDEYQDADKKEKEHYQVKIALQEDLSNYVNLLFSFFPTKVDINFPFIIHGTFDLDSSRNQLVKSDKNKFVLKKLVELIIETAKELSKNDVSWLPLEFLNYDEPNTVLDDLDFYETINKEIKKLALFPCVDNQYRQLEDVIYYSYDFSYFFEQVKFKEGFFNLVKTIPHSLKDWLNKKININFERLEDNDFVNRIDRISNHSNYLSLPRRAELIYILVHLNNEFDINSKYSLLLNDNKEVINKAISVFTPVKNKIETSYKLPSFVRIDFLSRPLFRLLLAKFGVKGTDDEQLQRYVKDIVALQPFKPVPVIEKMINQCNDVIKKAKYKNVYIKETIKTLFEIYQQIGIDTKPDTSNVLVITKNGKRNKPSEVFLSSDYPSGVLTENLFADIFLKNQYLASRKTFGLEKENPELVERFFVDFLGVNKYSKTYTPKPYRDKYYENFVFRKVGVPAKFRSSSCHLNKLDLLDTIIDNISKEKLVLWFIKDDFLRRQLNDDGNADIFRYDKQKQHIWDNFKYGYQESLNRKPSYIKYQIHELEVFTDYVMETIRIDFLNPYKIDFKHPLFKKYKITQDEINNTLISLGAKKNFSELGTERVAEILEMLPQKDQLGNHAQRIYKLAYEYFKEKSFPLEKEGLKLFAVKDGEKGYFPAEEIYYYDNLKLPKSIVEKEAILQFPKRRGEKQVADFFGIKTFKNFDFDIIETDKKKVLTIALTEYFLQIKPYLLTLRLNEISADKKDSIASQVNITKSVNIIICNRVLCDINGEQVELGEYDFINEKNEFYIKLVNTDNLEQLKKDSKFCDIISEILCIAYSVNEGKNEFRSIFKNELKDTEHLTIQDFGEQALEDARSYLGMSNNEQGFWKIIYGLKDKETSVLEKLSLVEIAEQFAKDFEVDFSKIISKLDYTHLHNRDNFEHLKTIFQQLDVRVDDFNQKSFNQLNFEDTHRQVFKNRIYDFQNHFKTLLWHEYNQHKDLHKSFLTTLNAYKENDLMGISIKNYTTSIEVDYDTIISSKISEKFHINIKEQVSEGVGFSAIFNQNLEILGLSKDDLDDNIKSLLCFEGNNELVKQLTTVEEIDNEDKVMDERIIIGQIVDVDTKGSYSGGNSKPRKKKLSAYNSKTQEGKNKAGKNAEKLVYDTLVTEFGIDNVDWVSGSSETKVDGVDGLGYDLTYKENSLLKYVEVKSFSGKTFFLTKNEKEFALAHAKDYEIFLVQPDNKILRLKESFLFNDLETFEQNSKFSVEVKDYIISLSVSI